MNIISATNKSLTATKPRYYCFAKALPLLRLATGRQALLHINIVRIYIISLITIITFLMISCNSHRKSNNRVQNNLNDTLLNKILKDSEHPPSKDQIQFNDSINAFILRGSVIKPKLKFNHHQHLFNVPWFQHLLLSQKNSKLLFL